MPPILLSLGSATSATVVTQTPPEYIDQLYYQGLVVDTPNTAKIRIEIKASGWSMADTTVYSATGASGPYIYEAIPAAASAEVRRPIAVPLLEAGLGRTKYTGLEVRVTNWEGAPITYTDLVVFLYAARSAPGVPAHVMGPAAGYKEF